jgi:hypothetical protein
MMAKSNITVHFRDDFEVPLARLAYTIYWDHLMDHRHLVRWIKCAESVRKPPTWVLTASTRHICKLFLHGKCNFMQDCKNIHVCPTLYVRVARKHQQDENRSIWALRIEDDVDTDCIVSSSDDHEPDGSDLLDMLNTLSDAPEIVEQCLESLFPWWK